MAKVYLICWLKKLEEIKPENIEEYLDFDCSDCHARECMYNVGFADGPRCVTIKDGKVVEVDDE